MVAVLIQIVFALAASVAVASIVLSIAPNLSKIIAALRRAPLSLTRYDLPPAPYFRRNRRSDIRGLWVRHRADTSRAA